MFASKSKFFAYLAGFFLLILNLYPLSAVQAKTINMGTASDVVSIPGTLLNGSLAGTGNRCLYVDASGNVSVKSYDCRSAADGDNLGNHSATQNIKLNTFWLSGDGGNEGVYVNSAGGVGINADSIATGLSLLVSGNLQSTGSVTFSGPIYAGGGNRMITVDNAGVLGAAAIPTDTDIYWNGSTGGAFNAATARTSLGLGSLATLSSVGNSQIADVAWSKITGFPTACSAGQYVSAVGGTLTCSTPAGGISGSGTANYVSKWTGGSALGNSVIYDNGTNVGIGTTNPGGKLHIYNSSGVSRVIIESATAQADMFFKNLTGNTTLRFDADSNGGYIQTGNYAFTANQPLYFSGYNGNQGSNVNFNFANSYFAGNVGIGTTNPAGLLNVVKAAGDNTIYADTYSSTGGNSNYWFSRRSHGNTVGTMTTTLNGDYQGVFYFQGVNTSNAFAHGAEIIAQQNGAAGTYVPTDLKFNTYSATARNANQLVLLNTGVSYFNAGNVGIGTTTPGEKLQVLGNISLNTFSSGSTVSRRIGLGTNGGSLSSHWGGIDFTEDSSNAQELHFYTSQGGGTSTEKLTIKGSGNVGIGTSTPSYNLQVNSSASFASNNAIFDTLGNLSAPSFTDKDNAIFKLDPSDTTTSLAVAGNINSSGGNLNIGGTSNKNIISGKLNIGGGPYGNAPGLGVLLVSPNGSTQDEVIKIYNGSDNGAMTFGVDNNAGNIKVYDATGLSSTKINPASIHIGTGYYSFQPYLQINHVNGEPFLKLNNGTDNVFTMAANCPTEIMVGVGAGSDRNKTMCQSGGGRIFIGNNAGYSLTTGVKNVAVGNEALLNVLSASGNTAIGEKALYANKSNNNVAIGTEAGRDANGTGNIFIGYLAGANAGAVNNTLYIDNSDTNTPLISGNFSTDALQINGSLDVTGSYSANGNTGYSGVIYFRNRTNTGACSIVVTGGLVISHNCP